MKKLKISLSKIAGNGVFSDEKIAEGDLIIILMGERCGLMECVYRIKNGLEEPSDPLQINNEEYIDLNELPRNINHSCEPNAFIRNENELYALREIAIGEEITYDYSTTMDENEDEIWKNMNHKIWKGRCNCGSEKCRGVIGMFKDLPLDVKKYYIENKLLPGFILKKFKKIE